MENTSDQEVTTPIIVPAEKEEPEPKKKKVVKRKLDYGMTSEELMIKLENQLAPYWIPLECNILESLMEKELKDCPKLKPLWMGINLPISGLISFNLFLKRAIFNEKSSMTSWTLDQVNLLILCLTTLFKEQSKIKSNELSCQNTGMDQAGTSTSSTIARGIDVNANASTSRYEDEIMQFMKQKPGRNPTGLNCSSIYVKTDDGSVTVKCPARSGSNLLSASGQPVMSYTVDMSIYPTNKIQGIRKQDRWRYATTSFSHVAAESDILYQQCLSLKENVTKHIMSHPQREIKNPAAQPQYKSKYF